MLRQTCLARCRLDRSAIAMMAERADRCSLPNVKHLRKAIALSSFLEGLLGRLLSCADLHRLPQNISLPAPFSTRVIELRRLLLVANEVGRYPCRDSGCCAR